MCIRDRDIDELDNQTPEIVDKDGNSNKDNLKDIISKALNNEKVTVKVQSISGKNSPPAIILLPEQMRRINDMGAYMEQRIPSLPDYHILLVNQDHPLIQGLTNMNEKRILVKDDKNPKNELKQKIVNHIYDMAKLSIGGLDQKQIVDLQLNNAELITELINSKK